VLSGRPAGSGRRALRTPPSITKWATWMPFGPSSRAVLCAKPQGEFAHRESCGERIPLYTGACAGQQNGAAAMGYHAPRRLLNDEEPAIRRNFDRLAHGFRIELGDWAVRSRAGVVEHHIGLAEPRIGVVEHRATAVGSVASAANVCARVSAASAASFSTLRAAKPTLRPAAAKPRASDALMPEPAPTIRAAR
jgi:hypothetical protein